MSELMKVQASDLMEMAKVSEQLVRSSFCGVKRSEDALWIIATGHSLGIDPVTSLRGIHVISGKPVLSADLMAAVAMRHPDCVCLQVVEMTAQKATVKVQRRGWSDPSLISFTIEDAKNAGLLNNPTWKKYPADMCKARAIARAARAAFPDALLGVYVEGEISEPDDTPAQAEPVVVQRDADRDVVDVTPAAESEVERWKGLMAECGIKGNDLIGASAGCAASSKKASVRDMVPEDLRRFNDKLAAMSIDARRDYVRDLAAGAKEQA